jgi:threonine dehydrogenase-like Zn-dependent dehydrogenase
MSDSGNTAIVAHLTAPQHLEFLVEDLPAIPADGIRAKTVASAISNGTEVAAWSGLPPLRPTDSPYPRLVGYMNVAEVEDVGTKVRSVRPGDRIYTHQSHRSRFVIPEGRILAILSPTTDATTVSGAYLYRLALSALRRGGFESGMPVAVIGLGVIGLAAVQLAAALGGNVLALSSRQEARDAAAFCGATGVAPLSTDNLPGVWASGTRLVITTSNRWSDWRLAMQVAGFNARIAVLGFPGRGEPLPSMNPLDSSLFYDKQLTIVAARIGQLSGDTQGDEEEEKRADMSQIIGWIETGRLVPGMGIRSKRSWSELPDIYAEIEHGAPPGVVVLDWST